MTEGVGREEPEAETTLQGREGKAIDLSSGNTERRPDLAEKDEGVERGKEEENERGVEKEGEKEEKGGEEDTFKDAMKTDEPFWWSLSNSDKR